jgi:exonuclease III
MYSTPPSTVAAPGGGPNPTPHPFSNNINIATVNVDGIKTKFNALKAFIASDQIKILSITETHTQNPIHVPNFSSYSRPSRFNNFYRGVALLIDSNINSIKHDLPPHLSDLEAVAADAQLNNKTITIISYYNPPSEPISPELFQYVSSLRYCIILGDFNARHTDFGDRSTNANGRKFSEFISDLSIYRLENRSATFISHKNVDAQSIVDHIVITESLTAHVDSESFIGTTVTSDHEPLVAKLFFEGPPPPPEFIQMFKYKNADWDKYRREITRTLTRTTPANTPDEIDEQINTFTNTIHSARDTVFKPTTIPKNRTPLPARIVKLIKEKRKVYREFIQSRDPLLKTLFNKLNAQIRRDINTYREETWIKTCESLDYRDGKKFWNKFKAITGQKRKTNHYLATDAHIYYTPQERANCFAELLDGIHQVPNDPNFNATFFDQIANNVHAFKNIPLIDPLPHPLHDEHLTDNITTDEVKTIISHLKNTKAPGPDQIRPILLKNLPDSALQALTDIFNNCMNNLYFLTAWKTAHTVMIPKPGKCPNDPKSYRPISLLSITGKIFERILTNRLQLTLESNNLLPPEQFGFRAQRSTHNPLAELQTDITRHANLGECTVGVFLDIERAFDKVWHDGLVQKLLNLRLNLKFTKLISSFLTNRSCRIKVNKSQSILFTFPKAQKQRTLFTQSRLIINRDVIPKNNTVQYLGITVSSTCTLHADLKATLKKARNRANLLYKIRGRLRGCAPETLLYTYNSFIRPVIEYRALLYSTLPKRAAFKIYSFERHILRDMFRLHRQHPSNTLYDATKTTPISERLTLHQARYVERTLNGNNTIAKQTLHTSHKLPTKNGLLNRVPKKPKIKTKHLPTAILSSKYPDLPPELQLLVDETPLSMR